jgi:hypothetical protein
VLSCPESAADGEVGLLEAPVEALVSSRSGGFNIVRNVFPAEGLRDLSTFLDSLSGAMSFAGEAKGIS